MIVGNAWSDDIRPISKTRQVLNLTSSSATLKGTVYSNNSSSDVFYAFQWGTTTSYENQTRNQSAGTSADRPEVEVSEELTNLSPNTTYHYRLTVWNSEGHVYGEDKAFFVPLSTPQPVIKNISPAPALKSVTGVRP